jgi:hypothetical protein
VKVKLDENLGTRCRDLFCAAGHDVATVPAQNLSGADDAMLLDVCRREGRALVTLDLDFANPLRFPPQDRSGIAVLRLPRDPDHADLIRCVTTLIAALEREPLTGRLWSVQAGRVRVYQDPALD